ncbi:MAG TPA: lipopolysaccharide heptosyltransferase II [Pseudorhodoplanes sp.]|nr:lipopolysaccharide heptosyltransferase II [Pseudorhodoplanes sp.]
MMQPRRLLIIKPSSFGDIIHSLPALALLRDHWPDTRIDWLVKEQWAELLIHQPALNEVLLFPAKFSAWRRLRRSLRERRYDMVIDLQGLLRSGVAALLSGAPVRVGFADAREGSVRCYTEKISICREAVHAVDRNIDLLRQIGIPAAGSATFPLAVPSSAERWAEDLWNKERLGEGQSVVVLHPAARGETKRWPAGRFAEVAEQLAAKMGARIILVAAREQIGHVTEVTARLRTRAINLAGATSLLELAALIKRASLVISNDSGPMHLAAALATPVVGLFGPTDPQRVGPYGRHTIALKKQFDCAGCSRRACVRDAECLKMISAEDVLAAASQLMPKRQARELSGPLPGVCSK